MTEIMAQRMGARRNIRPFACMLSPGNMLGEPRLLICLYGPELLHVDLKFITTEMLTQRVEELAVLFTRDNTAHGRQLAKI